MTMQNIKNMPIRVAVQMKARKLSLKSKQKGASALEYIVLAGAIAVVIAVAAGTFGDQVSEFFSTLLNDLTGGS